jgi:hypothetical protein
MSREPEISISKPVLSKNRPKYLNKISQERPVKSGALCFLIQLHAASYKQKAERSPLSVLPFIITLSNYRIITLIPQRLQYIIFGNNMIIA